MADIMPYMERNSKSSNDRAENVEHGRIIHVRVTQRRLGTLLEWWANTGLTSEPDGASVPYEADEAQKLLNKFPGMFLSESIFASDHLPLQDGVSRATAEQLHRAYLFAVAKFAQRLRDVWDSGPERRTKRWAWLHYWILELLINPQSGWTPQDYMEAGMGSDDPLDFILLFMGENLNRLRHCPNPFCRKPYFLAAKGNTKFCSPSCANYGRKQTQKRYWNAVGAERRKERTTASQPKRIAQNRKA